MKELNSTKNTLTNSTHSQTRQCPFDALKLPRSSDSLEHTLYPDTLTVMQRFGLSVHEAASYLPLARRVGVSRVIPFIGYAKCLGINADQLESILIERNIEDSTRDILTESLDFDFWQMIQKEDAEVQLSFQSSSQVVRKFPFQVAVYPERLLVDAPKENLVLTMKLTDDAYQELLAELKPNWQERFPGAAACIRFHMVGNTFAVHEVDGGIFHCIHSSQYKDTYKDWALCLMASLEEYLHYYTQQHKFADTTELDRASDPRVMIMLRQVLPFIFYPSADLMGQHILAKHSESDIEKRRVLYEELPKLLGYTVEEFSDPTKIVISPFPEVPIHRQVKPKYYRGMVVEPLSNETPQPILHKNLFSEDSRIAIELTDWIEERYDQHFPRSIYVDGFRDGILLKPSTKIFHDGCIVSNPEDFEIVPALPVDLDGYCGVRSSALKVRSQMLMSHPHCEILQKLIPHSVAISKGVVKEVDGAWWLRENPTHSNIRFLHIAEQNRHPYMRFLTGDSSEPLICLGMKGAGLRNFTASEVKTFDIDSDIRRPMYIKKAQVGKELIPSHNLWGGLEFRMAETEFVNTLTVLEIDREIAPSLGPAVPIPLDVVFADSYPIWQKSGVVEFISRHDFEKIYLDNYHLPREERPAILRTLSACDVRLSQVVNRILVADENRVEAIQSAIAFLYWLHGEELELPPASNEELISINDVFHYLAKISEANATASERLVGNFRLQLTRIVAAVHGLGGHLGGGRFDQIGAVGGGAPAIRNVDAAAMMHDFDSDVFIPTCYAAHSGTLSYAQQRANLLRMQWYDILYLRETLHWVENIFYGKTDAELRPMEIEFGEHNSVTFMSRVKISPMPLAKPHWRSNKNMDTVLTHIPEERTREIYRQYHGLC